MSLEQLINYSFHRTPRDSQRKALTNTLRKLSQLIWGVPGTGKTKIGVDFIGGLFFAKKARRALIVCPATALGVWEEQFELDAPHLIPQFMTKESTNEPNWGGDGIIITNYEYFKPRRKKRINRKGKKVSYKDKRMLQELMLWGPDIIIIDEGHKIKNPRTQAAKSIHKLADLAKYKMDLTGTPTGNKKRLDMWSHMRFLDPDVFNCTFKEYKEEYFRWGGFGGFKFLGEKDSTSREIDKLIRPYITVIRKKGIEQKSYIPYRVEMPPSVKLRYKKLEEEFIAEFQGERVLAPIALTKLAKLQQISGGFVITNEEGKEKKVLKLHTAKLDAAREIVEELDESGIDRVLIFAKYRWEIAQLEQLFQDRPCYVIHGDVKPMARKQVENDYNRTSGVAICQASTGSVALSFMQTDYAIFYSTTHSHIDFTQAQYRIDRGEYTSPKFYYLLQCKGTVDAGIHRLLRENREVADNMRDILEEMEKRV